MALKLYAMDTAFFNPVGQYPFDVRCRMLSELGYGGTYLTLADDRAWEELPRLATVERDYGLTPVAVYLTLRFGPAGVVNAAEAERLVKELVGCRTIEFSVQAVEGAWSNSDPAGDALFLRSIEPILDAAAARGITVTLYPHLWFWLERLSDAVRLVRRLDREHVRCVFCGYHWYAVEDGELDRILNDAAGRLDHANVCGAGPGGTGGLPKSIRPLDEGDLDNFQVLDALRQVGMHTPWVGIQGYSVAGDVYHHLRRSAAAFTDMRARLDRFGWRGASA